MADASLHPTGDGHGHGDHDHPDFLAHHFDDPQQQFDSGKLGMWLFLVTEVLFFSGMFCAYALYRSRNPEVYTFASQYLNETLGAFNTGVLLFSSLSMAWGVRCAQLRQRTGLVIALAITLGCASMFLGVKAIEYTHKWDLGLLPGGYYVSQYSVTEHHEGVSSWLYTLSTVPALCVVGFGIWYVSTIFSGKKRMQEIAGALLVTALCYFVGVFIGIGFESGDAGEKEHHPPAAAGHHDEQDDHGLANGHDVEDAAEHEASEASSQEPSQAGAEADEHQPTPSESDSARSSPSSQGAMRLVSVQSAEEADAAEPVEPGAIPIEAIDQPGGAGLFFSIYYCMTGVHAIHILGGMAVLAWLLIRATKDQFHEQYFGPVDYVGLYWHLVDLIWIYLFPLLYLIK